MASRIAATVLQSMATQALLQHYVRTPTVARARSGSSRAIYCLFQLPFSDLLLRGSPVRHRDLQTDIVRVRTGVQFHGHSLSAQAVLIDTSYYLPAETLIAVSRHLHLFRVAQG